MDARHKKSRRLEQRDGVVSNQRQVEIARARTVGIKRCPIFPPLARHRAAAKHDARPAGNFLANQSTEMSKALFIAAERQAQDIGALLLLREAALNVLALNLICRLGHQFGILPIFCVSSGAMAFIITDPCISTKDTAVDCIHPRKDEPEFEQSPMLFIHPEECIDCGACVPACPVAAIYDSPDATPATQKDLIDANAKFRAGDAGAFEEATNIVNAHVSAHPELMNIPGTERAAAHQG
jgi:ferredoxin